MTVAIGLRNRRVTLETPTVVTQPSGYALESYAPLATAPVEWVRIRPLRGSEAIRAQQVYGQTTAELEMRFRDDLTAKVRAVEADGTVWSFLEPPVDPDGFRKTLRVMVGKNG